MLLCKNRKLFTVAGDNSHVLTPIPMHSIPIPIPWLILLPFPWESHGTHAIPVFAIPMHTSSRSSFSPVDRRPTRPGGRHIVGGRLTNRVLRRRARRRLASPRRPCVRHRLVYLTDSSGRSTARGDVHHNVAYTCGPIDLSGSASDARRRNDRYSNVLDRAYVNRRCARN